MAEWRGTASKPVWASRRATAPDSSGCAATSAARRWRRTVSSAARTATSWWGSSASGATARRRSCSRRPSSSSVSSPSFPRLGQTRRSIGGSRRRRVVPRDLEPRRDEHAAERHTAGAFPAGRTHDELRQAVCVQVRERVDPRRVLAAGEAVGDVLKLHLPALRQPRAGATLRATPAGASRGRGKGREAVDAAVGLRPLGDRGVSHATGAGGAPRGGPRWRAP